MNLQAVDRQVSPKPSTWCRVAPADTGWSSVALTEFPTCVQLPI